MYHLVLIQTSIIVDPDKYNCLILTSIISSGWSWQVLLLILTSIIVDPYKYYCWSRQVFLFDPDKYYCWSRQVFLFDPDKYYYWSRQVFFFDPNKYYILQCWSWQVLYPPVLIQTSIIVDPDKYYCWSRQVLLLILSGIIVNPDTGW